MLFTIKRGYKIVSLLLIASSVSSHLISYAEEPAKAEAPSAEQVQITQAHIDSAKKSYTTRKQSIVDQQTVLYAIASLANAKERCAAVTAKKEEWNKKRQEIYNVNHDDIKAKLAPSKDRKADMATFREAYQKHRESLTDEQKNTLKQIAKEEQGMPDAKFTTSSLLCRLGKQADDAAFTKEKDKINDGYKTTIASIEKLIATLQGVKPEEVQTKYKSSDCVTKLHSKAAAGDAVVMECKALKFVLDMASPKRFGGKLAGLKELLNKNK